MTRIFQRGYAVLLSSLVLWSCSSDNRTASTEVENEMKSVTVAGIAATGSAASGASVAVYTTSGDMVGTTTTDSVGAFHVAVQVSQGHLPLLVHVDADSQQMYTLIADSAISSDTLFALVNPVTGMVVKTLLGPAIQKPDEGFDTVSAVRWDSTGRYLVAKLFGKTVEWNDLYKDRNFRPYRPGSSQPGASDALVHTLGDEARSQGLGIEAYLDSLGSNPMPLSLFDQDFRYRLATNMVRLGVDSLEAAETIRSWRPDDDDLFNYFDALHRNEKNNPPPDGENSPIAGMANRTVEDALRLVPERYAGSSQYSAAMDNLPIAHRIAMDAVLLALQPLEGHPDQQNASNSVQPFAREIAELAIRIIGVHSPDSWMADSATIAETVMELVQENAIGSFDVKACVDAADPKGYFAGNYVAWRPTDQELSRAIDESKID